MDKMQLPQEVTVLGKLVQHVIISFGGIKHYSIVNKASNYLT